MLATCKCGTASFTYRNHAPQYKTISYYFLIAATCCVTNVL